MERDKVVLSSTLGDATNYVGFRWFNGRVFRVDWSRVESDEPSEKELARKMMNEYADSHFQNPEWIAEHFEQGGFSMYLATERFADKGYKRRWDLSGL